MKIINKTRNVVLAANVTPACGLFARMKGLLGKSGLDDQAAIILKPCNCVHTLFMRFVIDVIFVDKSNRVVGVKSCLKPFRLSRVYFGADFAVEFPAGAIEATGTCPGDILSIE